MKRHNIKREKPEPTTSQFKQKEEHDLAYYIHDRVELINQVFSVIKPKDLKAMAPECVRHISLNDVQELCLEELLGISSKRLCAILDGCEPPSDTESSSRSPTPEMETISLDSISSDEEILSLSSSKKGKKHKHRHESKSKGKKTKKSKEKDKSKSQETNNVDADKSKASRAGLTVLELLELQARARAIRAQLQQEHVNKTSEPVAAESSYHSSDNEVEIKEEQAEVVEISSDDDKDEKPDLKKLHKDKTIDKVTPTEKCQEARTVTRKNKERTTPTKRKDSEALKTSESNGTTTSLEKEENTQSVTKRVNDLIITVPQSKQSRKIKLNRSNVTISVSNKSEGDNSNVNSSSPRPATVKSTMIVKKKPKSAVTKVKHKEKEKSKKKQKKTEKEKHVEKEGSDHDEITLQLSDSEKMDLLEDLDRKNFDNVTSSSSEDSESSSETESDSSQNTSKNANKTFDKEDEAITNLVDTILEKGSAVTRYDNARTHTNVVSENKANVPTDTSKTNEDIFINQERITTEYKLENSKNLISEKPELEKAINHKHNEKNKIGENQTIQETQKDNLEICENKIIEKTPNNLDICENKIVKEILSVSASPSQTTMCHQNEHSLEISAIDDIPLAADNEDNSFSKVYDKVDSHNKEGSFICNNENSEQDQSDKKQSPIPEIMCSKEEFQNLDNCMTETLQVEHTNLGQANKKSLLIKNESSNEQAKAIETKTEVQIPIEKEMSEGELSDRESSEVEAMEVELEIVCISDEDTTKSSKKKKKVKKFKKEKKNSKSDFRNAADENFYSESVAHDEIIKEDQKGDEKSNLISAKISIDDVDVDIYEILELSDDSSCYEVEGTILSKEPTAKEIEALSAKIDEIEREDVITNDQIRELEGVNKCDQEENSEPIELENLSWKDRYLGSKKVKRVLTTSNILNALRRKNKELKKKIEVSKKKEELEKDNSPVEEAKEKSCLEEGSIAQYNTLFGLTKYVDPAPGPPETKQNEESEGIAEGEGVEYKKNMNPNNEKDEDTKMTKEMKKDAKQLLKMYKKLLKYNDMNKQKDPNRQKDTNKKKKKKSKKNKDNIS